MPKVGGKHFAYTPKGMKMAKKAKTQEKVSKMNNPFLMGIIKKNIGTMKKKKK